MFGGNTEHEEGQDSDKWGRQAEEAAAAQVSSDFSHTKNSEAADGCRRGKRNAPGGQVVDAEGGLARNRKSVDDSSAVLSCRVEGPEAPSSALSDQDGDGELPEQLHEREQEEQGGRLPRFSGGPQEAVSSSEVLSDGTQRSCSPRRESTQGAHEALCVPLQGRAEGGRATAAACHPSTSFPAFPEGKTLAGGDKKPADEQTEQADTSGNQQFWDMDAPVAHDSDAEELGREVGANSRRHERIAADGSTYYQEGGGLSAGDIAQDIGLVQRLLSQAQAAKLEDNPDAEAAMVNADRKRAIEAQSQRVSEHIRQATQEFERALEERARRLAQGDATEDVPPAVPRVADTPLDMHGHSSEETLDDRLGREVLSRRQSEASRKPTGGGGRGGRRRVHGDDGREDDTRASRRVEEDCGAGLQADYKAQMDRELDRMGGLQNVPPLSSLIEQLESQDGNTL